MERLVGNNKKYYYEIQELIIFISINVENITFTSGDLYKAIDSSSMNQLEKSILIRWLEEQIISDNISLQIRGFENNGDVIYKIFDMNGNNWDDMIPLLLEPIFIACNVEYVLDLSGIKTINDINFEQARNYIDLDFLKLKYGIDGYDIESVEYEDDSINNNIDNINDVNIDNNNLNNIDDEDSLKELKEVDYSDIEEKYKENKELLESLKKLREMNIL